MFRYLPFFILIASLSLSGPTALGGGRIEVQKTKGEPVRVLFPDGRVAELVVDTRGPFYSPIGVEVTENTCNEKINTLCRYFVSLKIGSLMVRWAKHPEAAKIGQALKVTRKGSSTGELPLVELSFISQSDRPRFPLLSRELPREALECPDYSWLPGSGVTAPPSVKVARWDVELMLANPETGLMESRTLGMNLDLLLTPDSKGRLEITRVKHYTGFALAGFIGDVWSLSMKRLNSEEYCLISLKPNLSLATANFIKFLSAPTTFKPYLYGTNEYSGTAMTALIGAFLKAPGEYVIQ